MNAKQREYIRDERSKIMKQRLTKDFKMHMAADAKSRAKKYRKDER
jgi:hypothetical protein